MYWLAYLRADGVHSNIPRTNLVSCRLGEAYNPVLGSNICCEEGCAMETCHARHVHDATAVLYVLQLVLEANEYPGQVDIDDPVPLIEVSVGNGGKCLVYDTCMS